MPVTSVCLLSALVLLSVAQLALSSYCFCTNKDSTLLYNDEALTTIATEVFKINTCFLGTRFTEDDESRNKSKILIKDLSLGRCGIGSVNQLTEGDLTDKWSNINMPPLYFGLFEDFLEIPLENIKKRFLLAVDGNWSDWGTWSNCAATCGNTTKSRVRECNNPKPNYNGSFCTGNSTDEIACDFTHCPIDGNFGDWQAWEKCSVSCSNGTKLRHRSCAYPPPQHGGKNCTGTYEENAACNEGHCPINGGWGQWTPWSRCRGTCTSAMHQRLRNCDSPIPGFNGLFCSGDPIEIQPCIPSTCQPLIFMTTVQALTTMSTMPPTTPSTAAPTVHGSWNPWGGWSSCSATCENGVITRTRTCEKKDDMKDCIGDSTDKKDCTASPHCPVNGGYTTWSKWSPCPVTCGPGAVYRTRYCTNPTPAFGGQNCSYLGETAEASLCNMDCPIDGHWGSWLPWGDCSVSCDYGIKVRERKCDHPAASNGGLPCEGVATSTENCTSPLCSVDGKWSQWSDWSQCSCDHYKIRHRDCNNPTPVGAGLFCAGNGTEKVTCVPNPHLACPINGDWSIWLEWSSRCSVTCGPGVVKRFRQCSNPIPQNGGIYCQGDLFETRPCIEPHCPVDGVFTTWSRWGMCSVTCANGTQERNRTCSLPMYGGANCTGDNQDHKTCVQNPCPIDGGWSDWGSWSNWDKTCSFATRIRSRDCDNPAPQYHGRICIGEFNHTESTDLGHCPVDGDWGLWENWTPCSVTCLEGTHSRVRKCDSPTPAYNGSDCVGNETEVITCMERPTCAIDGMWGAWSEWFHCSTTCGPGENTRYRTCTSPRPQNGGKTCPGAFDDKQMCKVTECPVDGQWADWSAWNTCSVTCGNGTQTRNRSCSSPAPQFGGQYCFGDIDQTKLCSKSHCPINGSWSDWLEWSSRCSVTCGQGVTKRYRLCTNPIPKYGGEYCAGSLTEEKRCDEVTCPIDGQWGDWSDWSTCSCNDTRVRQRDCDNPTPVAGGKYCVGNSTDTESCQQISPKPCPINGGWSEWLEWSSRCSATCGQGVVKRYRPCANPIPSHGGEYCQGDLFEEKQCNKPPCTATTVQATTTMSTMPTTTPSTAAPTNFRCYTCDGPIPEFCMTMMKETTCPEPYCINELTNSNNGDKLLNRRCGTKHECDKDWFTSTSDNDNCMLYDDTQTVTNYIHCTFCCTDELCNKPTVPTADSLYKPQIN